MNLRGTLTGNKDTDMIILKGLDDRDLLSLCSVDQYTSSLCRDENFWKRRTMTKYRNLYKYKPSFMTWKEYYLKIISQTNSEKGIEGIQNGLVVYETLDDIIIQQCNDIPSDKILVIQIENRNRMIQDYINRIFALGGMAGHDITCAICRGKLSEVNKDYSNFNWLERYEGCIIKDIVIEDTKFRALISSPIVRGECGHLFHNTCINSWRKRRENCPIDTRQWLPVEMDSYVEGLVDNKYEMDL